MKFYQSFRSSAYSRIIISCLKGDQSGESWNFRDRTPDWDPAVSKKPDTKPWNSTVWNSTADTTVEFHRVEFHTVEFHTAGEYVSNIQYVFFLIYF